MTPHCTLGLPLLVEPVKPKVSLFIKGPQEVTFPISQFLFCSISCKVLPLRGLCDHFSNLEAFLFLVLLL